MSIDPASLPAATPAATTDRLAASGSTVLPAAPALASAPPAPVRPRRGYGSMWRGMLPELAFLLPLLPIVLTGVILTSTLFFTGLGMLAIVVGVFIALGALYTARGLGMLEVVRLRGAGHGGITSPPWDRAAPRAGTWGKLLAPAIDGHYWLYLLHAMIVNPIVGVLTWSISFTWVVGAVSGLSFWFWQRWLTYDSTDWSGGRWVLDVASIEAANEPGTRLASSLVALAAGVVLLLTLPLVTRGLTLIHWGIARGMLGDFRSERLEVQVAGLSASRTAAAAAEGTALRRLERDIHDGPQQRLVRLQMDIAAADRQLDTDPERARELLSEAMQQSRDALEELRALSRGFAPPILLDRGLVAALEALAVRSVVPATVVSEIPDGTDLPIELERNAYFIAAEALTNAAKHSGASSAQVRLRIAAEPGLDERRLELVVTDDGSGGATTIAGHGLAGLAERSQGVGGVLRISSPQGGPTTVTAVLPIPRPAG